MINVYEVSLAYDIPNISIETQLKLIIRNLFPVPKAWWIIPGYVCVFTRHVPVLNIDFEGCNPDTISITDEFNLFCERDMDHSIQPNEVAEQKICIVNKDNELVISIRTTYDNYFSSPDTTLTVSLATEFDLDPQKQFKGETLRDMLYFAEHYKEQVNK